MIELVEQVAAIDLDASGSIQREELRQILCDFSKAGESLDDEDIDALIQQADVDGDGSISYDEVPT